MHRSVKANGQVSLPHFPVSSGGSHRELVGHGEVLGLGTSTRGGKKQGRRVFPSLRHATEEMPLGVGQEPRVFSILAKPCSCTVCTAPVWSFLDTQVLIRALQWSLICPPGLNPSRDGQVGSGESLGFGHHPHTSTGAGAWPPLHRWWPWRASASPVSGGKQELPKEVFAVDTGLALGGSVLSRITSLTC